MPSRPRTSPRRRLVLAAAAGAVAALAAVAGTGLAGSGTAPSSTAPPTIAGTARDGSELTADPGTWSGTTPITYAYQWQRCNSAGGSCNDIAAAKNKQYTLTGADVGSTIRVEVTASNSAGSSVATSAPTATVAAAGTAPASTAAPSISGTAREGSTFTASRGTWSGTTPISYAYQWQRCDTAGADCKDAGGATKETFKLGPQEVGRTVRVVVTATNSAGSAKAASAPTAVVTASGSALPASSVSLPNRLVVASVAFTPNPLRSRDPFEARVRVTDVSGVPVRDAIVFVRGIPERRIAAEPEARTGGDGVAVFTLEPTSLLPLRAGGRLTMFVRARKEGDRLIAGVTGSRLVSLGLTRPT